MEEASEDVASADSFCNSLAAKLPELRRAFKGETKHELHLLSENTRLKPHLIDWHASQCTAWVRSPSPAEHPSISILPCTEQHHVSVKP